MSSDYAVVNGQRIELDNDDVDNLIKKHKQSPFCTRSTLNYGDSLYFVYAPDFSEMIYGEALVDWVSEDIDDMCYVRTHEFAKQIYLREVLNRKLMHYAIEHGEYVPPTYDSDGCFIVYEAYHSKFIVISGIGCNGCVMFKSRKCAEDAIREVVEPFVKDHPELDYTIQY